MNRQAARTPDAIVLGLMLSLAGALTFVGLSWLRTSAIGATIPGALRGTASQLARTGPAAVLVAVVTTIDLLMGAVVLRAVRGKPYGSWLDVSLFGLSGAVLVNTLVLCLLGAAGLFTAPVVLAAHLIIVVVLWNRSRPFVDAAPNSRRSTLLAGFAVFLVIAWCGPLILQLASPVVPFRDVLHNHVAPVEFVRTYHAFPHLFTSPAPETGPSRQILGYLGVLTTVSTTSARPAALAAAAFALPMTILLALAVFRFAEARLHPGTGRWALVVMPLTFVFLHLPDSRGTDLAIPLALTSLLPLPELTARRRVLTRAALIAAIIYVHPLLGLLTLATHGLLAVWLGVQNRADEEDFPVMALVGALAFAAPEFILMAGHDAPSWVVVLAIPLGIAVCHVLAGVTFPARRLAIPFLASSVAVLLIGATTVGPRIWTAVAGEANLYPLTTLGFAAFALTRRARSVLPYLFAPLAVGVVAYIVATFFPSTTVFWNGSRDEVTGKIGQYWWPIFLAFGTACALCWAWEHRPKPVGQALVGLFLVAAVLPIRQGSVDVEDNHERRIAETLSIHLRKAETGAWVAWPDARNVVDASQRELIGVFRGEQRAGRMTRDTQTLHVAVTRWTWDSTPIGAFAGVYDTNFSETPDISGHTLGGRLHPYADLPSFLNDADRYVLLEPSRVPPDLRQQIVSAGYVSIFRNTRGEIFRKD